MTLHLSKGDRVTYSTDFLKALGSAAEKRRGRTGVIEAITHKKGGPPALANIFWDDGQRGLMVLANLEEVPTE